MPCVCRLDYDRRHAACGGFNPVIVWTTQSEVCPQVRGLCSGGWTGISRSCFRFNFSHSDHSIPPGFFFLVAIGAVRTGLCIIIESQPPSAAVVVAFFDQLIYFDLPTKCRPRSQIHPVNQRISVAHMIVYRNRIPTHTSR